MIRFQVEQLPADQCQKLFRGSVSDLEFVLIWYFLVGVTSNNVKQKKELDKTHTT